MSRARPSTAWERRAIVALLLLLAPATAAGSSGEWSELVDGGTTVLYHVEDERSAETVLAIVRLRAPGVAADMSLSRIEPLRVIVASTHDEFRDLTSGGVPDWGVGCAFPERGVVVLKSPRIVSYPLKLEDVTVHELAHVAAGRVLGDVWVPRWFHEGVAMAAASEWRLSQSPAIAAAAATGRLIPLGEIERHFPADFNDALLAYAESFHAVRFLAEEAGLARPSHLVPAVRAAGDFDAALEALVGMDRLEFEEAVEGFFGRRFTWGMLLAQWNPILLIATALFIVALFVRRGRSRRVVREWEHEEERATRFGRRRRPNSWE